MSELTSWEDMTPLEQAQCTYWDMYKDAYGHRPRGIDTSSWTLAAFDVALKSDKSLIMMRAERLTENASAINNLTNAREIVRWSFDDKTAVGDGSKKVFEQENQ